MKITHEDFLSDVLQPIPWTFDSNRKPEAIDSGFLYLGKGNNALELTTASATKKPDRQTIRDVWRARYKQRPNPILLVIFWTKSNKNRVTIYQPSAVARVQEWFIELWERASEYDLASLYEARFEPYSPWLIYLRMLYERYGKELQEESKAQGFSSIRLTSFQIDGMERAKRILQKYNGVVIADEVGLGKTFIAGELLREAVHERRQRTIIIAPATLRDGPWESFKIEYGLSAVEILSYEDLVAGKHRYQPEEYAMVVVDEAHYLRNPNTYRAESMRRLLTGGSPKDILFLTATPVNNSLWDMYNLISYFIPNDGIFADIGIPSLRGHFAKAMAEAPDDLTPDHLFDVLDSLVVRRNRKFVKTYYPNEKITIRGEDTYITFPTPHVNRVAYDLSDVFGDFFQRFAAALPGKDGGSTNGSFPVLTLARYAPSAYRLDGAENPYELQLAGLLRSGLLKRFESSAWAFARTCEKMAQGHDSLLRLIEKGKIATGRTLTDWASTDTDDIDDLRTFMEENAEFLDITDDYDINSLKKDIESDRNLLKRFAEEAYRVAPEEDPKLKTLVDELAKIASDAAKETAIGEEIRDKRKVLIFTYFADTAEWIYEYLSNIVQHDSCVSIYRDRIGIATGKSGKSKEDYLWGFAPKTTDAPYGKREDKYDILVSTDVLAEGVNLQQCRHIINYDLPWNPMRLVQRHGRIDRIGSPHSEAFLHCIFPDQELNTLLGLEERLQRKIKQAAVSIGVSEGVLPGSATNQDLVYAETHDEMLGLRSQLDKLTVGDTTLFRNEGEDPLRQSGEELRKILKKALTDNETAKKIRKLPYGAGSGFIRKGSDKGWVFCIRVADHPNVLFRYVYLRDSSFHISRDTLTAFAHAQAPFGDRTERFLTEEMRRKTYDAWNYAKKDVFESWSEATDPAKLTPAVPKVLREASKLVRENPPKGFNQKEIDKRIAALESPHPHRIQRYFREILTSQESKQLKSERVLKAVYDLGLRPSPAPEPLPPINEEDIYLVAWIAIVAE